MGAISWRCSIWKRSHAATPQGSLQKISSKNEAFCWFEAYGERIWSRGSGTLEITTISPTSMKLSSKYFGVYKVLQRIRKVTNRLELPPMPKSTMCSMSHCLINSMGPKFPPMKQYIICGNMKKSRQRPFWRGEWLRDTTGPWVRCWLNEGVGCVWIHLGGFYSVGG